jgi:hypothetical protein
LLIAIMAEALSIINIISGVISLTAQVYEFTISLAALFYEFTKESISLSHEPSRLYDTTQSWKPLLKAKRNFLEIFDIPLSPGKPAKILWKATDVDDVEDAIKDLPAQEEHTIRVYFTENINTDKKRPPLAMTAFTGFPAMISQWTSPSKQTCWETHSFMLSLEPTSERAHLSPYFDSVSIAAGTIRRTLRCMIDSMEDGRIICK